jgi:hypothetical protein
LRRQPERHIDRFWDEPEPREAIGDGLLACDHVRIDRNDAVVGAVDKTPHRFDVN